MDQLIVFSTLILALGLFGWGKLRHDFVALIALFILVTAGIVSPDEAFSGFGHPAVITVAAVLIIGKALEYSGLVDVLGRWVMRIGEKQILQIMAVSVLVAAASAFMNNVGAVAVMMPIALHMAQKSGNSPSYYLMPLSFASLLGGMMTLIGTPPNIIIATFRAEEQGEAFGMFDYSPVGAGVALTGVLFVTLVGWRFLPKRAAEKSEKDLFEIDEYITEVRVKKDSKLKEVCLGDIDKISKAAVQILGLIRRKKRIHAPDKSEELKTGDIIILETDAEELKTFLNDTGLELVGGKQFRKDAAGSKKIKISEVIVVADSPLIGQTASSMKMRSRFGVNLLAVARRGKKLRKRIDHIAFQAGDVLLLQGRTHMIDDVIPTIGCLPLARRGLRIGYKKKISLSLAVFTGAVVLVVTGLLPVQMAFTMAAVAMVLSGVLPLKEMYAGIDWPVIVLLGAMIPVGGAMETSGGAELIANQILNTGEQIPFWALITLILVITMFLSDIINNAATVVLMAPVGISLAHSMGVSIDPFLMAIAVGGSCAFLTPIGHQSNTLVMGPGGYRFSDYWRMGLPLEILIVLIGAPLILFFWPA
jgi:di/tricarboxylate transporter